MTPLRTSQSSFATLRGLAKRSEPADRCDLCGLLVGPVHDHLLDPKARRVLCACLACATLFPVEASAKYKRVPRRVTFLAGQAMTDAEWDALAIPIGLAFFVGSEAEGCVSAIYPSPAGPVESLLSLDAWNDIASQSAAVRNMEADVEAFLANRAAGEYYIAPIDECFRLTGLIRAHWRGLSGGSDVWREIRAFFDELRRRSAREAASA